MTKRDSVLNVSRKKQPDVSIVVPVYNVEKFLEQCIQSVVQQDFGFDKIQLVLVNDGSRDRSGEICQRYATRYPENVVYIDQANAGVSEARNVGIKNATGKYIGFVDADDYLSTNTVNGVMEYFKTAPKDVDVATVRVIQFGHYVAERAINDKFNSGTQTIDLTDPHWSYIHPRVAPAFIKSAVAKRHLFDKEIGLYEDTRYMGEVLAESMKLGVVARGAYYNRIHNGDANASITTGAAKERRLYVEPPRNVSLYLLEKFKGDDTYPPLYFQYLALYEMRWRIFYNPHNPADILSKDEYEEYQNINKDILGLISDEAIITYRLFDISRRLFLLNMKHSIDVAANSKLDSETGDLLWQGSTLFNYRKLASIKITHVHFLKNEVEIEGFFSVPIVDGVKVRLAIDGDDRSDLMQIKASEALSNRTHPIYNSKIPGGDFFTAKIPVLRGFVQNINFTLALGDDEAVINKLRFTDDFYHTYEYQGDYTVHKKTKGIAIRPIAGHFLVNKAMARMRYLVELGRRAFRKAKRICIRMIKMLR